MKDKFSPFVVGALAGLFVIGLMRFGMSLGNTASRAGAPAQARGGFVAKIENGVQRVTIGFSNATFNYEPSTVRLKRGVPVELTLDTNIPGCMGIFISREFNLRLEAVAGKNTARFTPERAGAFPFSCPMGMGRGTFIVE